ncbi:MAG TPA: GNAT family N-acetyltransferase [Verrucomicrobiae bacterium]|nr:GNAT family N-acetyltransferase [Verrucomicrobiae bacterium]
MPPSIRRAVAADAAALTDLINRAFRVEEFFVYGDRITLPEVEAFLERGEFLAIDAEQGLVGCVYLEIRSERAYFGLLSIDPARQRAGIGRRLIEAAEARARERGCAYMDLQIVNLREELPEFYERLGYRVTGEAPFPEHVPTKLPCHFVKMSKLLVESLRDKG